MTMSKLAEILDDIGLAPQNKTLFMGLLEEEPETVKEICCKMMTKADYVKGMVSLAPKMEHELSPISELDWARFAAYIDGEGMISIRKAKTASSPRFVLTVMVTNTNYRLMEWLKQTFGGCISCAQRTGIGVYGQKHKDMYYWQITNAKALYALLRCLPYMIIKSAQANLAVQFRLHTRPQTGDRFNRLTSEELEVREQFKADMIALNRRGYIKEGAYVN
jgi:hypothetical protein